MTYTEYDQLGGVLHSEIATCDDCEFLQDVGIELCEQHHWATGNTL